jgi:hypothetical protein
MWLPSLRGDETVYESLVTTLTAEQKMKITAKKKKKKKKKKKDPD